ncbi:MAG TPA: alpha/beta hydrolase fold domain-containing protein [Croceibacterium sp.]|nr:alpha/beta hydrolase fold domain-containing protein [Croceibacterium sp.]
MMRLCLLPICILGLASTPVHAQQYSARLYPGPAPGSESWQYDVVTRDSDGGQSRYNTRDPRVEVFLPDADKANGAAVVMLPGGGLRVLGLGADLHDTVARFNAEGVAVIVLEYRTLQLSPAEIERASAPRPASAPPMTFPKLEIRNANANPAPGDAALGEVLRLAIADGQEALRLARAHAAEWRIDPNRVGMIGTSAGGGVAFGAMLAGERGATPDFIVSIFGPSLQDVTVPANAPPLFLVTESNHGPVTDGLVALFQLWKEHGQQAELHAYEVPNFSMRVRLWGNRLFDWMREQKIVPEAPGK